jgi:hypothetical protein
MSTPLRLLLTELLDDTAVRSAFDADPEAFLAEHGWDGLDGADVHTALDALTHELPVDQAARLAPLVADDVAFDGDGLSAAIAGLQAATAAVEDLAVTNGADDGAIEVLTDDPAAGIDSDSDGGSAPRPHEPDAADAEEDGADTDPSSGIDDLSFGDAHTAPVPEAEVEAGADDEVPADAVVADAPPGVEADESAAADLFGHDPASFDEDPASFDEDPASFDEDPTSFDDRSSRDFYDPGEETSEPDGTEEPDDGFPY